MAAPWIAVAAPHLRKGRIRGWRTGAFGVPDRYVDGLRRAGARVAIVPIEDGPSWEAVLEAFGGLLLIGGGDVEPRRYGADRHPEVYGEDPERDEAEIGLVHAARRWGTPTLAICRGAQVMNVAFGGTLHQHIPDLPAALVHASAGDEPSLREVKVSEGSALARACGTAALVCACHHHQSVDGLGDGLRAVAWSEDGLVEAIEHEEGWMTGVQWHPEDTAEEDPAQQALFAAFTNEVAARAQAS